MVVSLPSSRYGIVAQMAQTVTVGLPLLSRTFTVQPSLLAVGAEIQIRTSLPAEVYPPPRTLLPAVQLTVIGLLLPFVLADVERFS